MRAVLRWCRGLLGTGVTWGAVWAGVFLALTFVAEVVAPGSIGPGEGPIVAAGAGALFGFVSGVVFGLLVSLAEGHRRIGELSLSRAAVWGMLGTAVYPLVTAVSDGMLLIVCPIGAGLAAASVALAQRAERRALIGSGARDSVLR